MARILIAEPHPDIAPLFARMVASLGHEPVVASHEPHDVVLVNVDFAAGRDLAAAMERAGRPFVCVTTHDDCPLAGLRVGISLVTPFSRADLRTALDRVLATADAEW